MKFLEWMYSILLIYGDDRERQRSNATRFVVEESAKKGGMLGYSVASHVCCEA
jgi:hypothetical protein